MGGVEISFFNVFVGGKEGILHSFCRREGDGGREEGRKCDNVTTKEGNGNNHNVLLPGVAHPCRKGKGKERKGNATPDPDERKTK